MSSGATGCVAISASAIFASRAADPQAAGDELQQRQAHRGVGGVEPAGHQRRQLGLGRRGEAGDHLGQARRTGVGAVFRPHQRHRLGEVADIIVRPREQFGIGPGGDQVADHARFGGGERQLAGDGCKSDAAIGVGLGREVAPQQRDLGEPAGGEHQALQQVGEGDHAAVADAASSSSSSP